MLKFLAILYLAYAVEAENTIQKHGKWLQRFEDMRKDSRLSASILDNDGATEEVFVGTHRQLFRFNIEMSHNRLWVISPKYPNLGEKQKHYYPENSTTSEELPLYLKDSSGSFVVTGQAYRDNVWYNRQHWPQIFGTIEKKFSNETVNPKLSVEGILGIGWKLNESRVELNENSSVILHMLKKLDANVVTFWQHRETIPGFGFSNEYLNSFGKVNMERCLPSDLSYVPLQESLNVNGVDSKLVFEIDTFQVGKQKLIQTFIAFVNNGLPFIYVPDQIYSIIYKMLNPSYDSKEELLLVDCTMAQSYSNWTFTIGGKQRVLEPKDFVIDINLPNNQCVLALEKSSTLVDPVDFVLGTVFMRKYCLVFDIDNNRVGFAEAHSAN